MRRIVLLALVAALAVSVASAQTTQVTGQVKDSNGIPYAGAQMKAGLVFNGTPVSNPTVTISTLSQCRANGFGSAPCQVPFAPTNGPFNLDTGGNIPGGGITLQDNSLVTPSGTQWAFTVSTPGNPPPLGTGPQTCSATITITGAAQSISSSFAACPALSNAGAGGGFNDPAMVGKTLPSNAGTPQIRYANQCSGCLTFTIPQVISQGDTITCMTRSTGSAGTSLTDTFTPASTFTQIGTKTTGSTFGTAFNVAWWQATNVAGGTTDTITFNGIGASAGAECVDTSASTVDGTPALANSPSGTTIATGSATTTQNLDLIMVLGFANIAANLNTGYTITSSPCPAPYGGSSGGPGVGVFNCFSFTYDIGGVQGTGQSHFMEQATQTTAGSISNTTTDNFSTDFGVALIPLKGTPVTPILSNATGTGPFQLCTITGPLTPCQFTISGGQIGAGQNQFTINVTSGTCTSCGYAFESSIDGGLSWSSVPCVTKANFLNVVASEITPLYSAQCSLVGLIGESGTNFRFGVTQGFGIANLNVWGAI